MSTVKTDAIVAVSTNGNLDLSGQGTGGVAVSDYLILSKGADIASATALTLGKDGSAFDVTGTTAITSIGTQGVGSHVTLHFDGALTFTHHATDLILPGAANITTAAGDIAVMYEYASGDWRCVSYTKASGAAVVAAGGAWNVIATAVASNSASLTVTGLDSTYDTYAISWSDIVPASNSALYMRFGDSSGVDSGGTDYRSWFEGGKHDTGAEKLKTNTNAAQIFCDDAGNMVGNQAGEGSGGLVYLHRPGDGAMRPTVSGTVCWIDSDTNGLTGFMGGERNAVITLDRIQILMSTGNIATGRMTVWGIAHA